ncbi:MAG: hypothetical protein WC495_00740 [Patescibacteria group bacterium]
MYKKNKWSVQQISDYLHVTPYGVRNTLKQNGSILRNRSEAIRALNITKYHKGTFKIVSRRSLKNEKLKIAGTMMYWGEGTKNGNSVVLSNSDPEMIKLFLKFLRTVCGISENRLRIVLHYYANQEELSLKRYWCRLTRIPLVQFSKSFKHRSLPGSYRQKSVYGTISLRYSDKKLLEVLNSWIHFYSSQL